MNAAELPFTPADGSPTRAVLQRGYGGPEVLGVASVPRPSPGEREVLVRVAAAGIDRGTWHLMTGRPYVARLAMGLRAPRQPVPGLDLAGTVVALGPGVTRFREGDAVFGIGQGSFAEYAVAKEEKLARAPARLPLADAAALAVSGITALQAVGAGALRPGARVLVLGASGGVGTYAVQLARASGAEVTAVCSAAKLDLVRSLGAARALDYRTVDFTKGGIRYDLVLDAGGGTPVARLRRVMTATGTLVIIGSEGGGDWTGGMGRPIGALLLAPLRRPQRFVMLMPREHFSLMERLAAHVDAGEVRPVIDRRVGLEGVADALRDLEAGRVRGKILVDVAGR